MKRHSLHLLILLYFVLIILMGFDLNQRSRDEPWLYQFVLIIQGMITFFMTIGHLITRQKLYFADFLGPCLMFSFTASIMVVNLSGIYGGLDEEMNYVQVWFCMLYYVIYLGLFNIRFLKNFIIRQAFWIFTMGFLVYRRRVYEQEFGDEKEAEPFLFRSISVFLVMLFFEVIFFVNHKDHAKLFLSMKVTEMHQQQLLNLLDSVPDKVLIVKEPQEGLNPKCIYSNRKMNLHKK